METTQPTASTMACTALIQTQHASYYIIENQTATIFLKQVHKKKFNSSISALKHSLLHLHLLSFGPSPSKIIYVYSLHLN